MVEFNTIFRVLRCTTEQVRQWRIQEVIGFKISQEFAQPRWAHAQFW